MSIIPLGLSAPCAGGFVRYANYNSGWRVLHVGGNWNNGGNAGLFYFNANNASSDTNSNVGARLLVFSFSTGAGFPSPLGENIAA